MLLALMGDTMLGRGVAEALRSEPRRPLVSEGVAELLAGADLVACNLECCISERGSPWPAPGKPFHFRAPPVAAEVLAALGVGCVTLANNHAVDYGAEALADTLDHLAAAGIATTGAGADQAAARRPALLEAGGVRLGVLGVTDHPEDFAAASDRPGVAYADLYQGVPEWLAAAVRDLAATADVALVSPHWGPNMTTEPPPHVRRAAAALLQAGATLVAGHSAHLPHGVAGPVLHDLGDFIDDYAVDPRLRNDLSLLFLVTVDERGPSHLEAVPLALDYAFTRLATGKDATRIAHRFQAASAALGTPVTWSDGRLRAALQ